MVIARLDQAVSFANRMALDAARLREFFDVLDTAPAMHDRPDAVDPGRFEGRVEFDNVSFAYDGSRPAVSGLSFTALPGETIALVGATGAGKSTALMLLHRAFDPQSGTIRIDGRDVRDFKLGALRRNIGVVFQEALLFNRSIAENLRAGRPDATDEQMRDAVARAQALEFIEYNADGFEAKAGERGRALSGGERQRLSIARALLKDPPILILDEATSALDAAHRIQRVLAALDEVMKNRTTFVIAHRLATIRKATRILVFDGGRIVETGSFDELYRLGGRFTAAYQGTIHVGRGLGSAPYDGTLGDAGEHRPIGVAEIRRDADRQEGQHIERRPIRKRRWQRRLPGVSRRRQASAQTTMQTSSQVPARNNGVGLSRRAPPSARRRPGGPGTRSASGFSMSATHIVRLAPARKFHMKPRGARDRPADGAR